MRLLFYSWFLLLPFSAYSAYTLGTLALDKLLAPVLLVAGFTRLLLGQWRISSTGLLLTALAAGYFFLRELSFLGSPELISGLAFNGLIHLGYFVIPMLYVGGARTLRMTDRLVVVNAAVGCLSAFAVAIGLVTLPQERFSVSRIGIADLPKSIGLFTAYGDLAQYLSYAVLLAVFFPWQEPRAGVERLILRLGAFIMFVFGLLGTQSRNILLTVISAVILVILLRGRAKIHRAARMPLDFLTSASFLAMVGVLGWFYAELLKVLGGVGGAQAMKTALDRLEQYRFAAEIIVQSPILGADAATYRADGEAIGGVHNFYLSTLAHGGAVALAAFLSFVLVLGMAILKGMSDPMRGPHAPVNAGHLGAVLLSSLFYPADTPISWALLGVSAALIAMPSSSSGASVRTSAAGVAESSVGASPRVKRR